MCHWRRLLICRQVACSSRWSPVMGCGCYGDGRAAADPGGAHPEPMYNLWAASLNCAEATALPPPREHEVYEVPEQPGSGLECDVLSDPREAMVAKGGAGGVKHGMMYSF